MVWQVITAEIFRSLLRGEKPKKQHLKSIKIKCLSEEQKSKEGN
jgi:hypothetical protein